jgi:rare lipoprotein A
VCRSAPGVRRATRALALAVAALALGCAVHPPRRPPPGTTVVGIASWYGPRFHGRRTANGEIYDMHRMTAAHKTLPFDTLLQVRNLENGRSVLVRVNDRGPHVKRRIVDLSFAAADELGMLGSGIARVELRILRYDVVTADSPRYTVQVGAFGEADRAAELCEELRGRYPEAEVSEDGAWHRVRVGAFARRTEAEDLRRELLTLGLPALVVALR